MKSISAWLPVDANDLPNHFSAMLFAAEDPSHWRSVAVSLRNDEGLGPPLELRRFGSTFVRFTFPDDTKCVRPNDSDRIISLADVIDDENERGKSLIVVLVPCLPASHARDAWFADETSKRGFESNMKQFLHGRGEWLDTRVFDVARTGPEEADFEWPQAKSAPEYPAAQSLEKLATAAATAMVLARSDLGKGRAVTFDRGTLALLHQIISGAPEVPSRKTLDAIGRKLVKTFFAAARRHAVKPGAQPKTISWRVSPAYQIANLLRDALERTDFDASTQPPLPFAASENTTVATGTPDEIIHGHVIRHLVQIGDSPTARDIEAIIEGVLEQFDRDTSGDLVNTVSEGLKTLFVNIDSPDERIDRFRERFDQFPALIGAAYVFWGWSTSSTANFEQRVKTLKTLSRDAYEEAFVMFAAAVGGGRVPAAFLQSRLWKAAYEGTWDLFLRKQEGNQPLMDEVEIWSTDQAELAIRETGPVIEIRLYGGQIPLGLRIEDRPLAVQNAARRLLSSDTTDIATAKALLEALDGDILHLPQNIRSMIEQDLSVHLAGGTKGEFDGSTIKLRNVKEKDLTVEYRWTDPSEAARKLLNGKGIERLLERLSASSLEEIGRRLSALAGRLPG